jgi:hypothetical protein
MRKVLAVAGVIAFVAVASSAADAQLVRLGPGAFTAAAPTITFSEQPVGTVNPIYTFASVPDLGIVTVSFAGAFNGQTVTGGFPLTLSGSPSNPLGLNTSVITRIVTDASNSTSPVLSGDPTFNGPIVIFFSQPVAAVALDGGFFNAIGATSITGFDVLGNALGSFTNSALGIENYGFADASGNNVISGLAFYITGEEPAGFAIDNVQFGAASVVTIPGTVTPEPSTVVLFATGLIGVAAAARRRRKA